MTVGGDLVPAHLGAQSAVCCAAPEYEGTRTLGRPRCTAGGVRRRAGVGCPPTELYTQSKSKITSTLQKRKHYKTDLNNKNFKSISALKCKINSIYQEFPSIKFNRNKREKQEREKTRTGV